MTLLRGPIRITISLTIVLAFVIGTASSGIAATYHAPMNSIPIGHVGVHIVDQAYWGEGVSGVFADVKTDSQSGTVLCGGVAMATCDFAALGAVRMRANIVMPKCANEIEENCIEGLSVYQSGQEAKPARYLRQVAGSTTLPDLNQNLTRGSTASLWNVDAAPNSSGATTYSALAVIKMQRNSLKSPFKADSLSIMVMPYDEKSSRGQQPSTWVQNARGGGGNSIGSTGGNPDCAWVDVDTCGLVADFLPGTRVRLSARITNSIGGWFKGRMDAPDIAVSKFSSTANKIVLDGAPSVVPQFFSTLSLTTGPNDLLSAVGFGDKSKRDPNAIGGTTSTWSDQQGAFDWINQFRGYTKDTAAGTATIWSAGTIPGWHGGCFSDTSKLLGIVSTNAMVYEGQAPNYDGKALSYRVAGLHYLPGGSQTVEGSYDLVMRSDIARCMYGFTKAPISATVSVVSSEGATKVATTVVSEKDGWLKLGAYGFTFSENSIRARITQKSQAPAKSTITCVKGKLTKKVTAVGPKCPTGYKKKP
jgi:hypothetical protein